MMFRVVITDHSFHDTEPERDVLKGIAEVVDESGHSIKTEDDVIAVCADADALITGFVPITAKVMDASPRLRCIVRYGVGYDNVDVAAATERGIWVANVPDYCIPEVADHTLSLILALSRRILNYDASVRRGEWEPVKTGKSMRRLEGQILGLIGFGRIGREVASRAAAFGYHVIVYDKYLSQKDILNIGYEPADLKTVLSTSDALSVHLPLNPETRHLLDADAFSCMKKEAVLVNAARGAIVDLDALAAALHEGRIAGAALDVYEIEPLPKDSPIRTAPNTILQPHASWFSEDSLRQLQSNAAAEVARVLKGEKMKNPVNKPAFPRV